MHVIKIDNLRDDILSTYKIKNRYSVKKNQNLDRELYTDIYKVLFQLYKLFGIKLFEIFCWMSW